MIRSTGMNLIEEFKRGKEVVNAQKNFEALVNMTSALKDAMNTISQLTAELNVKRKGGAMETRIKKYCNTVCPKQMDWPKYCLGVECPLFIVHSDFYDDAEAIAEIYGEEGQTNAQVYEKFHAMFPWIKNA